MNTQTPRAARIDLAIREALAPTELKIHDDSARHAHHAGAREAGGVGQSHYTVLVVSTGFDGMSRIARQRLVHGMLAAEFESGLHALALTLRTPGEQESQANAQ